MIEVELPDGRVLEVDAPDAQSAAAAARAFMAKSTASVEAPVDAFGSMPGAAGPAPRPQQSLTAGPSWLDNAKRKVAIGAQNVGSGLAGAAGLAADIGAGVINLPIRGINWAAGTGIPVVDKPFGGSEAIEAAAARGARAGNAGETVPLTAGPAETLGGLYGVLFGAPIPKELQSPQERMTGSATKFATENLAAAGPLAMLANARKAELATQPVGKVSDALLRPYFDNATTTVKGDVAAGAGSGIAVNALEENKLDGPVANAFATLAGGVGGSTAREVGALTGSALKRSVTNRFQAKDAAGNRMVDPESGAPVTRGEAQAAGRMMQDVASNPSNAARSISDKFAEFSDAGLPTPTIGLISDDVGLQAAESAARTKNGVPFIESDNRLRSAASDRVEGMKDPGADQSAVRVPAQQQRTAMEGTNRADLGGAETDVRNVQGQRVMEGAPLATRASTDAQAEASRRLDRAIVDEGYIPARAEKNRQFDQAPGRNDQLPADDVLATVDDVLARNNALRPDEQLPTDFVRRLEALRPQMEEDPATGQMVNVGGPGTARGADLADARKYLATAHEQAQRRGNFDLADSIQALRRAINATLEDAPGYAEANANYGQFADRYRPSPNDPGAKFTRAVDRDPQRGNTPPSETANRFLADPESATALNRMSEGNAGAQAAAADALRSEFAMRALNPDGTVNPQRAQAWLRNRADVLETQPAVRDELQQVATRARRGETAATDADTRLREARERVRGREAEFERSAAAEVLREDPRDVARSIFGSAKYGAERKLDEIDRLIGTDAQARRGWKAAVSEVISDMVTGASRTEAGKAGTGAPFEASLAKLDRLFKDNETLLAKVYTPEEMSRLRQAHAVLEPLKNASVRATAGSNTADKAAQLWRLAEAGLKAKFGVLKGGGYLRTLRVMAQTLPDNSTSVQRLIERAWFEPELAQYLLTQKLPDVSGQAVNKRLQVLIAGQEAERESE